MNKESKLKVLKGLKNGIISKIEAKQCLQIKTIPIFIIRENKEIAEKELSFKKAFEKMDIPIIVVEIIEPNEPNE